MPNQAIDNGIHPLVILVQRRWQLFACLLIVGGIAFASTYMTKPHYESTAQMELKEDLAQYNPMQGVPGVLSSNSVKTQCELLLSNRVLATVADRLNWSPAGGVGHQGDVINSLRDRIWVTPVNGSRMINVTASGQTGKEAADLANEVVAVFIDDLARMKQEQTAHLVRELKDKVSDYTKQIRTQEQKLDAFRKDNLITAENDTLGNIKVRISRLENEMTLVEMKRLDIEGRLSRIKQIEGQVAQTEANQDVLPVDVVELVATVASLSDGTDEFGINQMRERLNMAQREELKLSQAYLPGHVKLKAVQDEIRNLKARLAENSKKALTVTYNTSMKELMALIEREKSLDNILEEQKTIGVEMTRRQQAYGNLLANLDTLNRFKDDCVSRLESITLNEKFSTSSAEIVNAGLVPQTMAGLNPSRRAGSILLIGLVFSIMLILSLDRFSRIPMESEMASGGMAQPMPAMAYAVPTYGGPVGVSGSQGPVMYWPMAVPSDEVDEEVDEDSPAEEMDKARTAKVASMLGRINGIGLGGLSRDDLAFAARCRVVHTDQRSEEASAFRDIGTKLLSQYSEPGQSVAITSPTRQCGKTTLACNVALVLAASGRKVALVDIHPQASSLHRVFSLDPSCPDIGGVLANPERLADGLQDTDISNLKVLACNNKESWLHQTNAHSFVELNRKLTEQFDWVIYDTGTVHGQLTGNVLQAVGKALAVCLPGETSRQSEVVELIEQSGAECIGCIENSPAGGDRGEVSRRHTQHV